MHLVGEGGVSWLAPHFEIFGDRSVHYGAFDCAPEPAAAGGGGDSAADGGACC